MDTLRIQGGAALVGGIRVPGDKSISHRSILLGALGEGATRVTGFLDGRDCLATVGIMQSLGVGIERHSAADLTVHGVGLHGLRSPDGPLDCRNSGTTMRLLSGLMVGQRFASELTGSPQLCTRPMDRVVSPLRKMGASISGADGGGTAPLQVQPPARPLRGVKYAMPVASAQVKSCLLLAGLYADSATTVIEPGPTRDHTECMLRGMGANVVNEGRRITLEPPQSLHETHVAVPGDPSSAAFLMVAACIVPDSRLRIVDVGLNPTRTGLVDALLQMGADIRVANRREVAGEAVGDLVVGYAQLRGSEFGGDLIVRMIDELPLLALACSQAEGPSRIRDAQELKVKESNRILDTERQLARLGAEVHGTDDGFEIDGDSRLRGARVDSRGDHRLAMLLSVAGLAALGETRVHGADVTDDSFPGFADTLAVLGSTVVRGTADD